VHRFFERHGITRWFDGQVDLEPERLVFIEMRSGPPPT
jgi:hypothetical protein